MRILSLALLLALGTTACIETSEAKKQMITQSPTSAAMSSSVFSGLKLPTLDGKTLNDDELQGRVVLVVNVASQCGYTRQYEGLQALYDRYAPQGFTILGVPCNQFGRQEPGAPEDILNFTKKRFGVSFPLLAKQDVNGAQRSELLTRLMNQSANASDVRWNFEKFLVGRNGQLLERYGSSTEPGAADLHAAIERALASAK